MLRVTAAGSSGRWTRSVRIKVIIDLELFSKLQCYLYLEVRCVTEIPRVVKMIDKVLKENVFVNFVLTNFRMFLKWFCSVTLTL